MSTARLLSLSPGEAADVIAEQADPDWTVQLLDELEQRLRAEPLSRICAVWDLSNAAAARMFGVSRQAFSKWLEHGPPAERAPQIADLAAVTDVLVERVQRERIAAVVRRKAERLDGRSLIDLATEGRTAEARSQVREWFDLRRVQP